MKDIIELNEKVLTRGMEWMENLAASSKQQAAANYFFARYKSIVFYGNLPFSF